MSQVKDLAVLIEEGPIDISRLRVYLQKLSDRELLRFGRAAEHMCSPKANRGSESLALIELQLREARDEYRRRKDRRTERFALPKLNQ